METHQCFFVDKSLFALVKTKYFLNVDGQVLSCNIVGDITFSPLDQIMLNLFMLINNNVDNIFKKRKNYLSPNNYI